MIAFVLHDARVEALGHALDRAALEVEAAVAQPRVPRDDAAQSRHRQAAFPALLHLVADSGSSTGLTRIVCGTGSASG